MTAALAEPQVHVTLNKNSVPGDKSAMVPGGVRIGSPAMTTRGMVESDFVKVADLIDRCAPGFVLSACIVFGP